MKKKPTLRTLRRKLDKVFSVWVRKNHAGFIEDQLSRCVTCGVLKAWKQMHAGHFIPRQHTATRYDIRNVHPQCARCNTFRHGNLIEYNAFMLSTYGQEVIDELRAMARTTVKLTRADYMDLIESFTLK